MPDPRPASAHSTCSTRPTCASESATDTLDRAVEEGTAPTNDYTVTLVRGVVEHQGRIDELLSTYSEGWTLDRMPAVDRNVLRLGVYELLYVDDVPDAVAVSEAMALVTGAVDRRVRAVRQRHPRRRPAQQGDTFLRSWTSSATAAIARSTCSGVVAMLGPSRG